jgi:hypothetical protein
LDPLRGLFNIFGGMPIRLAKKKEFLSGTLAFYICATMPSLLVLDNVCKMAQLSVTAVLWTDTFIVHCTITYVYIYFTLHKSCSTAQAVKLLQNFVVVGTKVSLEEEERESLRAVGVGTWWKT